MSNPSDPKGVHHTEKSLRARYVRRADSLIGDAKQKRFASAVKDMQRDWDHANPGLRGILSNDPLPMANDGEFLPTLGSDLLRALAIATDEESPSSVQRLDRMIESWHERSLALARRFWPPEEFPSPLGDKHHLAIWFVDACLTYGPNRIGNWTDALFPEITPLATFDAFLSIYYEDVEPLRGTGLRYDGMTPAFQARAAAQVESIRQMARPAKSLEDRVHELRQAGLSQDSVAEQTGMTPEAVRRLSPGRSANPRNDV